MASKSEKIFVGSRGFAAALDARSGEGIWRTRFPSGTPSGMVTMILKGGRLFMGYSDRAYCLDAGTGSILWTKEAAKDEQPVQLAMEGATECVSEAGVAALVQE